MVDGRGNKDWGGSANAWRGVWTLRFPGVEALGEWDAADWVSRSLGGYEASGLADAPEQGGGAGVRCWVMGGRFWAKVEP